MDILWYLIYLCSSRILTRTAEERRGPRFILEVTWPLVFTIWFTLDLKPTLEHLIRAKVYSSTGGERVYYEITSMDFANLPVNLLARCVLCVLLGVDVVSYENNAIIVQDAPGTYHLCVLFGGFFFALCELWRIFKFRWLEIGSVILRIHFGL